MKDLLNQLLLAFDFFEKNPKANTFPQLELTKDNFLYLTNVVITQSPKYQFFTEKDFEKLTFRQYGDILKEIQSQKILVDKVPRNIQGLVENYEKYQADKQSADERRNFQNELTRQAQILRLKKMSQAERTVLVKPVTERTPVVLSTQEAAALSENIEKANNNPTAYQEALKKEVAENLSKNPEVTKIVSQNSIDGVATLIAASTTEQILKIGEQVEEKDSNERKTLLSQIVPPVNPIGPLKYLSNPNSPHYKNLSASEREKLMSEAALVTASAGIEEDLVRMGLPYGQNTITALRGDPSVEYREAREEEKGSSFSIDLNRVKDAYDIYNKFFGASSIPTGVSEATSIVPWYNPATLTTASISAAAPEAAAAAGFETYASWGTSSALLNYFNANAISASSLPLLGAGQGTLSNEALFSLIQSSLKYKGSLMVVDTLGNVIGSSIGTEGGPYAILAWNGIIPGAASGTVVGSAAGVEAAGTVGLLTAGTEAVAVGGTELAVAGTGVAAAATTATVIASAVAIPVIGAVVGLIVTAIAKRVLPWLKRNLSKILMGFGGIFAGLGIVGGSAPFLFAGTMFIGGAMVAGGLGTAGAAVGGAVVGFFGVWARTVVAAIVLPLVITLIGVPLAVVFILFIINSGAYVVPPATSFSAATNTGIVAAGTCPVQGSTQIVTTSYNPATETGHGSNRYWGGGAACTYSIPIPIMYPGCAGPNIAGSQRNVCSKEAKTCPYYGYAVDVADKGGATVALPFLCDKGKDPCPSLNWTMISYLYNCKGTATASPAECPGGGWGWLAVFKATGNGHTWQINLNHVNYSIPLSNGATYPSGSVVGTRTPETDHVHIELDIDGTPVKPDFLCGGH
ncbi:MAG TPA: hypothetical protein VLE44_01810 [Candidatus Saccharimonadales bacterium]|nr:hypothetical protein [Candidatus Saccharimonadales bacterium]